MANYSAIKAAVNAYIKANGRKEITGMILNSVLNATIDSLGRYFQFAGGALPTDDPGTPDQNVCYLATEPGVYIHFGNIRIENEEVALLFWDGTWRKNSILIGIREVFANIDNGVGTPSVDVSFSQGRLVLSFHNLKGQQGDPGDPAGFGTIRADVNNGVGTPGVSVETSGDNTAKNILFHFTNLKGDPGVSSVIATIDDTSGNPSCHVSLVDGQLTLAFSGLKGLKGDTGVSADYPITIYNGLDSDATDMALAAAQGKLLDERLRVTTTKVDGVVDYSATPSPNLFDKTTIDVGKYINKNTGTKNNKTSSMGNVCATDYITIPSGATSMYIASVGAYSGSIGWAAYDSTNTFTHGGTSKTIAIQEGDVYIRFSVYEEDLDIAMFIVGTADDVPPEYVPYGEIVSVALKNRIVTTGKIDDAAVTQDKIADGAVFGRVLADGGVTPEKTNFFEEIKSKNLLDPDSFVAGKWVNADGGLSNVTVSKYGYYSMIPVMPETGYCLTRRGGGTLNDNQSINGYIGFYDADGVFISSTLANNTTTFTTPAGCAFASFSVVIELLVEPQLEVGNTRTEYEEFFDRYVISPEYQSVPDDSVTTAKIVDKAVTQDKIADGVMLPTKPQTFEGFRDGGTIEAGQMLSLPQVFIKKAFRLVATIVGTFESVEVGVGRTSTYGKYVEITQTDVVVKVNGSVQTTIAHGLTLGQFTKVLITKNNGGTATIKVVDDYGNVFTTTYNYHAVGTPFLYNGNASIAIAASLSFMPGDLLRPIWIFGDSYLGDNDQARWMYHVLSWGYDNFLLDARSGENATQGLVDLQSLISTGAIPSFIVWLHGMNNGTDQDGNVNATWMEKTQAVLDICTTYGITPILATIPTIPSAMHDALNAWVRSSGYRYIDFASAVESNVDDYWRGWGTENALLSNDEVHPTSHGAVELAMRVLQDFPEITIAD